MEYYLKVIPSKNLQSCTSFMFLHKDNTGTPGDLEGQKQMCEPLQIAFPSLITNDEKGLLKH